MDNTAEIPTPSSRSILPGYRTSFGEGMHDECMDASIKLDNDVTYGAGRPHNVSSASRRTASSASASASAYSTSASASAAPRRSLADVFLSENDDDDVVGVGMEQTERGARLKKVCLWGGLILVLGIIFITAPKPGFIFGSGGNDEANDSVSLSSNDGTSIQAPTLEMTTTTAPPEEQDDTTATQEAEDVQVEENEVVNGDVQVDMNRMQALQTVLLESRAVLETELQDKTSPQFMALRWLATDDSEQLDIPGYEHNTHTDVYQNGEATGDQELGIQLLQRYALGTFYFAMQTNSENNNSEKKLRELQGGFDDLTQYAVSRNEEFQTDWTSQSHACDWFGVDCDMEDHILSVNLTSSLLEGTLVKEIFQQVSLPFMTSLDLSFNSIKGPFPHHQIVNEKLEVLLLGHNELEQDVEAILGHERGGLVSLINVDVSHNKFTGTLPDSWQQTPNLHFIRLENNGFKGTLPASIGAISNLEWLQFDNNGFTGTIPNEWSSLTRLHTLRVSHNDITGQLPAFLGNLPMIHISVDNTKLAGDIPTTLGQLSVLRDMYLQVTDLQGNMPDEICKLFETGDITILTADCSNKEEIVCDCCTKCF